jgi:hypothetical protein
LNSALGESGLELERICLTRVCSQGSDAAFAVVLGARLHHHYEFAS